MGKGQFVFGAAVFASSVALFAACGGNDDVQVLKSSVSSTASSGGSATGGGGGATMDAGPDIGMPSDTYPAPHGPPPTVITFNGPVLKAPKIQPIFFSNDDPMMTASIVDFVSKVGATMYWAANVTEYGVGAATALPTVQLT